MSVQPSESSSGTIEEKLVEAWKQEQRFYNLRGGARFLIWVVALLIVDLIIDWQIIFRERWEAQGALMLMVNLAILAWVFWHEWLRYRKPFDPVRVALEVENKHPELRSILVSFTQLKDVDADQIQASPALLEAMREQAISITRPLDFREVVDLRQLKNLGLACFLCVAVFSAISFRWEDHMRALLLRLMGGDANYPTETTITFVSGSFPVRLGDTAEIRAEVNASKIIPATGTLYWRSEGAKETPTEITLRNGNVFVGRIEKIVKQTEYRLEIGDDLTDWHTITVSPRPVFTDARITVVYPEYLDLNQSKADNLNFAVPEGCSLKWHLECSPPITELNVSIEGTTIPAEVSQDGTIAIFSWPKPGSTIKRNFTYHFPHVKDKEHEFSYTIPGEQEVEVIPDQIPEIEFVSPPPPPYATTNKILAFEAVAKDDYALDEAMLVFDLNGREEKRISMKELTGENVSGIRSRIKFEKPLSELVEEELKPKDTFNFSIQVSDKAPPKGTHFNLSSSRKFTILTDENYLRWFKRELEIQRGLIAKARDAEIKDQDEVENLKAEENKE